MTGPSAGGSGAPTNRFAQIRARLAAAGARLGSNRSTAREMEIRLADMQRQLAASQQVILDVGRMVDDEERRNVELNRQLLEARDQVVVLREQLEYAYRDTGRLRSEIRGLNQEIQTISRELEEASSQNQLSREEIARLTQEMAALRQELESAERTIDGLLSQLGIERERAAQLAEAVAAERGARENCEADLSTARLELDAARNEVARAGERARDAEQAAAEAEGRAAAAEAAAEQARQATRAAEREAAEANNRAAAAAAAQEAERSREAAAAREAAQAARAEAARAQDKMAEAMASLRSQGERNAAALERLRAMIERGQQRAGQDQAELLNQMRQQQAQPRAADAGIEELLRATAKSNPKLYGDQLRKAMQNNDLVECKRLLKMGASINDYDERGESLSSTATPWFLMTVVDDGGRSFWDFGSRTTDRMRVEEAIKFPQWYNFDTQLKIMDAVKESGQRFYHTALGTVTLHSQPPEYWVRKLLHWKDERESSSIGGCWPLYTNRRLLQRAIDLDLFAGKLDLLKYCSAEALAVTKLGKLEWELHIDQLSMIFELGVQQYRDANREQDAIQWVRDTLEVEKANGPPSPSPRSKRLDVFRAFFTEQAERVGLRI